MEVVVGEAAAHQHRNADAVDVRRPIAVPLVACCAAGKFPAQRGRGDPGGARGQRRPQHREAVLADAAGPGEVTVEVAEPFPGADRREVLGAARGHPVLRDCEVRDPVQADLSRGPGLGSSPGDEIFVVVGFLSLEQVRLARRGAAAAGIRIHDCVATRHPERGVWRLPSRPRRDSDPAWLRHDAVLRVDRAAVLRAGRDLVLAIGVGRHDDGNRLVTAGAEHIDPQHGAIAHRHGNVALDHPVGFGGVHIHPGLGEQTDAAQHATEHPRGRMAKSLRRRHRHEPDATAGSIAARVDPRGSRQVGIRVSRHRLAHPSGIAYA